MNVELNKVGKIFRHPAGPVVALKAVSLDVPAGSCLLLTGPPGSGKSTLLALAGGLMRPTVGDIFVGDRRVSHLPEHALARLRLDAIGFLFQGFRLIRGLSAVENIELALVPLGLTAGERRRRSLAVLDDVGLAARSSFRVNDLSGGEQQRVALARALVHEPALLIADEPTSSVDKATAAEVLARIADRKKRGTTLLLASHDPELVHAAGLVDRVARFEPGGRVHVE